MLTLRSIKYLRLLSRFSIKILLVTTLLFIANSKDTLVSATEPNQPLNATAQHQNGAAYAYWKFDGPGNDFWNVDQYVNIAQKAAYTYWAQYFTFTGSTDGGYIGLQTNGYRFDGSIGELAIFSLWNANAIRGSSCNTFAGEGSGYSCRIPFSIETGVWYKLRVWRLETDSGGQWWGGWITSDNNTEYHIGDIRVPTDNHLVFGQVQNFSEYFGPAVACNEVPRSIINLTQPVANSYNDQYNYYQYYSTSTGWNKLDCTGAMGMPTNYVTTWGLKLILGGNYISTNSPTTLQTAINQASTQDGIVIIDRSVTNITLTSPLTIPPNVKLLADCSNSLQLNASFARPVQLSGSNYIQGITIKGSSGPLLGVNTTGNTFYCTKSILH